MSDRHARKRVLAGVGVAFGVLAAACSSTSFVKPHTEQLVLGRTTHRDIIALLGRPQDQGEFLRNGQTVTSVSYGYADAAGEAASPGVTPARAMAYYFVRDTLVGYEFVSTFREDSTDFDDARAGNVKAGITTEGEVIALLGPPGGRFIFPLTDRDHDRALVYMYAQRQGDRAVARKHLLVIVDRAGVVREVQLEKSGD